MTEILELVANILLLVVFISAPALVLANTVQ